MLAVMLGVFVVLVVWKWRWERSRKQDLKNYFETQRLSGRTTRKWVEQNRKQRAEE